MKLYHVTAEHDLSSIEQGITLPDNEYAQFGAGFYFFREFSDAVRWKKIREILTGERSVVLEFEIADEEWQVLVVVRTQTADNFQLYGEDATRYDEVDVLEGPWSDTADPLENGMVGAWQYKFHSRTFDLLNTAVRREVQ